MILQGKNLIIKAGGVAIAAARSCTIRVQAEQIPISSPTDGAWQSYMNGRKSWSISTNHLLTTLRNNVLMVGTQVSLGVSVSGTGILFNGFVDNPTLQSGSAPSVTFIVWDKTRKKFLACLMVDTSTFLFYQSWSGNDAYTNIDDYTMFLNNGDDYNQTYVWIDGELFKENLTGNANVQTFAATGNIGNLAQGSFEFVGNGALSAASLP